MVKKITLFLYMLNMYGYFYQTVAMSQYTLQTKNGLTVLCKKMSNNQISLEDLRTICSAFNPDWESTLCNDIALKRFKSHVNTTNSACCRAQVENTTVGLIKYTEESDHLYICLLAVIPEFQKMGVAGALIQYLESLTKQSCIRLNAEEGQKIIFEKLGFKDCGTYMEKISKLPTHEQEVFTGWQCIIS